MELKPKIPQFQTNLKPHKVLFTISLDDFYAEVYHYGKGYISASARSLNEVRPEEHHPPGYRFVVIRKATSKPVCGEKETLDLHKVVDVLLWLNHASENAISVEIDDVLNMSPGDFKKN